MYIYGYMKAYAADNNQTFVFKTLGLCCGRLSFFLQKILHISKHLEE